jgi:hypothetical protein
VGVDVYVGSLTRYYGPAPCFTDKPGWDGDGGALLLAAHDEHPELPPPAQVSADWPELLSGRQRLDGWPPGPAGNGLAVLLRLAERSVAHQVPMKLDF